MAINFCFQVYYIIPLHTKKQNREVCFLRSAVTIVVFLDTVSGK